MIPPSKSSARQPNGSDQGDPTPTGPYVGAPAPDQSPGPAPRHIGRFELRALLGQGAFGTVYRAYDPQLDREVALKVPRFPPNRADLVERFLREARSAARLRHPGIVATFEVGTASGEQFIASELVTGQTLHERLKSGEPPTVRQAVGWVRDLALALEYAHGQGIVHRDIKPTNIMIDVHNRAQLMDFGLAKRVDLAGPVPLAGERGDTSFVLGQADSEIATASVVQGAHAAPPAGGSATYAVLTAEGAVVGTPAYMSPEQARGTGEAVGPASDQYSLGVVLYELLTGRQPFGGSVTDILRQVTDPACPVRSPCDLNTEVPRPLARVCLRALAKEPAQRFDSAADLAVDLQRWLSDQPVRANRRPQQGSDQGEAPTQVRRRSKKVRRLPDWCRAHPRLVLVSLLSLVLLIGFLAGKSRYGVRLPWQAGRNLVQEAGRDPAQERLSPTEMAAYVKKITLAQTEWEHGSATLAWQYLQQCPRELRGWEHRYLVTQFNRVPTFRGHVTAPGNVIHVWSVAISADGKRLVSAGADNTVKVWDANRGTMVLSLAEAASKAVALSPDGKRIISGSWDKTVKVWDADKGIQTLMLVGHTQPVTSVATSADGKRIVSGAGDSPNPGEVTLWDADNGTEMRSFKGHTRKVTSVAISADGKRIVSASGNPHNYREPGEVKVWDADKGTQIHSLNGHPDYVTSVAISADGKRIVSGGGTFGKPGLVKVWDADRGTETLSLKGHGDRLTSVAISADGKRIVGACGNPFSHVHPGGIKVWDADRGTEVLFLRGYVGTCDCVALSADTTVKLWNADKAPETLTLEHGPFPGVGAVAIGNDGERIASASGERLADFQIPGEMKIWDAHKGTQLFTLKGHARQVNSLAFSADGKRIVSGSSDGTVKVWDVDKGIATLTLEGNPTVASVAFSADGRRIVGGCGTLIKVWDADNGKEMLSIMKHAERVFCVAFSPDGKRIVSTAAGTERIVKVWDADNGTELLSLKGHATYVNSAAFSSDGQRIVTGSSDKTVKIWDANTGAEIHSLTGHNHYVRSVAFSPDGKRIVSGGEDYLVKVWDADTGMETLTLKGHTDWVTSVAFSADGMRIVSGSRDGTVKVWEADKGTEVP
jgi:WD40 repeat protein/serine/threonine protein kinase